MQDDRDEIYQGKDCFHLQWGIRIKNIRKNQDFVEWCQKPNFWMPFLMFRMPFGAVLVQFSDAIQNHNIQLPDTILPFQYQVSLVFRSPL